MTATWTKREEAILQKLDTPAKVQVFLDSLAYNTDDVVRSPRLVIQARKAHCLDGALFAAAALAFHGREAWLLDLVSVNDDDHVLCVYKERGRWGSLAKSNYTTIRSREPVYRTVRELAMSYFDLYFNSIGQKTLRKYSRPFSLKRFGKAWLTTTDDLNFIGDALGKTRHYAVLRPGEAGRLGTVSRQLLAAGLAGADPKGLFKPRK